LATVSRYLKIRKDHLEALEEDRIEALPGRTYAVGFIRSYADYLGLDAVQCVERFKAEIAGRSDPTVTPITVIDEDAEHRMPHGWKIIAGVVVVLVLVGAYQVAAQVDRMMSEKAVEPVPALVKRPVAHKPVLPKVETAAASVTVDAQTPNAATQTPVAGVTGEAAALPGQVAGQAPVAAPLPQGQVFGDVSKPVRVVLRAREATRILVQGPNNRIIQNRMLQPGDSYRVPNLVGLTLTTSNAGAVQVELDGAVIGIAGKAQETAEAISLDPQSIMDRNSGNHGR